MEDRYLFKGKEKDSGKWLEWNAIAGIPHNVTILTDTICQCTGSRDKNSKLIYDNDIAKDEKGNLYKAFWQKNYYQYFWICIKSNYLPVGAQWNLWSIKSFEIEVIGNIFDNPELLESEG
mgnify:CR=1 FL=1